MKKLLIITIILAFISCKKEEKKEALYPESTAETSDLQRGQELFEGAGNCISCHQPDQKVIGPSLQEIAKIYKEQNGDMVQFLKGKAEPIVDPSLYETMKTNFAITKNMPDSDLKAIETYIYSHLQ